MDANEKKEARFLHPQARPGVLRLERSIYDPATVDFRQNQIRVIRVHSRVNFSAGTMIIAILVPRFAWQ
jgi:hypothetical protein